MTHFGRDVPTRSAVKASQRGGFRPASCRPATRHAPRIFGVCTNCVRFTSPSHRAARHWLTDRHRGLSKFRANLPVRIVDAGGVAVIILIRLGDDSTGDRLSWGASDHADAMRSENYAGIFGVYVRRVAAHFWPELLSPSGNPMMFVSQLFRKYSQFAKCPRAKRSPVPVWLHRARAPFGCAATCGETSPAGSIRRGRRPGVGQACLAAGRHHDGRRRSSRDERFCPVRGTLCANAATSFRRGLSSERRARCGARPVGRPLASHPIRNLYE